MIVVEIQNKENMENMQMEAVLINDLRFRLKKANYFRDNEKGNIIFRFKDHGKYNGSAQTESD